MPLLNSIFINFNTAGLKMEAFKSLICRLFQSPRSGENFFVRQNIIYEGLFPFGISFKNISNQNGQVDLVKFLNQFKS